MSSFARRDGSASEDLVVALAACDGVNAKVFAVGDDRCRAAVDLAAGYCSFGCGTRWYEVILLGRIQPE